MTALFVSYGTALVIWGPGLCSIQSSPAAQQSPEKSKSWMMARHGWIWPVVMPGKWGKGDATMPVAVSVNQETHRTAWTSSAWRINAFVFKQWLEPFQRFSGHLLTICAYKTAGYDSMPPAMVLMQLVGFNTQVLGGHKTVEIHIPSTQTMFFFPMFSLLSKVESCLKRSRSWCGSMLHWSIHIYRINSVGLFVKVVQMRQCVAKSGYKIWKVFNISNKIGTSPSCTHGFVCVLRAPDPEKPKARSLGKETTFKLWMQLDDVWSADGDTGVSAEYQESFQCSSLLSAWDLESGLWSFLLLRWCTEYWTCNYVPYPLDEHPFLVLIGTRWMSIDHPPGLRQRSWKRNPKAGFGGTTNGCVTSTKALLPASISRKSCKAHQGP